MFSIYHVTLEDDDVGEVEGFFGEDGSLLTTWSINDAQWRPEYMNSLIEELGIQVKTGGQNLQEKLKAEWLKLI